MSRTRTVITASRPFVCALASLVALGCAPPPEDADDSTPPEEEEGAVLLEAPGGSFLDVQCGGKHSRHPIAGLTFKGAHYAQNGGVQTFEHLDTSCNRVEIDTNDHYEDGRHTFEGEVKIGQVSGQSVLQIFNAPSSGPIVMIKAYRSGGGTLKKLAGSVALKSGIVNEWVRVRVVHDLGENSLTIFIDGKEAWSGSGGKGGGFNLKYGNYGTGAPAKVQWRNVSW